VGTFVGALKDYSPECVEGVFSKVGLPLYRVLRSSPRMVLYSSLQ
jgi:hypothetical protein